MMPLKSLVAVRAARSVARSMNIVSSSATATSSIARRSIVAASIGVSQVGGCWRLTVLLAIVAEQFFAALAGEIRFRAWEVNAFRLRKREEIGDQQGRAADQRHSFKSRDLVDLADYMCALVGEKRKEEPVGSAGGNLGEDGEHVRVAFVDGDRGDGAAKLLEGGSESAGKAGRVRVTIVNNSHAAQMALVVGKNGYRPCLVEIVVGSPVVAGMVVGPSLCR